MHRPQTPQPGFGSITLLQKFTSPFQNPGSAPDSVGACVYWSSTTKGV